MLEELSKTNAISVSVAGPLKDSATVAVPTFLGGLFGGPGGAVFGIFGLIISIHILNIIRLQFHLINRSYGWHRNSRHIKGFRIWWLQTSNVRFKRRLYREIFDYIVSIYQLIMFMQAKVNCEWLDNFTFFRKNLAEYVDYLNSLI